MSNGTAAAPTTARFEIPQMPVDVAGFPAEVRDSLHPWAIPAVRAALAEPDWNRQHHYQHNPTDSYPFLIRDLHWFTENLPAGTALPTMLAERVLTALGFEVWEVVDFVKFYTDDIPYAERADAPESVLLRALRTIAAGLPWRTAACAQSGGLSIDQIHEWLDVFGAASLEACIRAGIWWHDDELPAILRTRTLPDQGSLDLLGGLNNCKTRD